MRCTKCSFISFDDLSACAKCSSDLSSLSKELNGTCIETRQEFFLGSAIKTTALGDDGFSDSQALPPIDHSQMNFDDTSTGNFSPISAPSGASAGLGFDDSLGSLSDDDVSIELGDIMPIDLDQLDSNSVLSDVSVEHTDAFPAADFDLETDKLDIPSSSNDKGIDLDLTGDFSGSYKFNDDLSGIDIDDSTIDTTVGGAGISTPSSFDSTSIDVPTQKFQSADFALDGDYRGHLSGVDGNLDETISLNFDDGFSRTHDSRVSSHDGSGSLELDESLVAELAGDSSLDSSGEFSVDFSTDHSASGGFELDDALVAELASNDSVADESIDGLASSLADVSGYPLDFEDRLAAAEIHSPVSVEDLTGDFPPLREDDDAVLAGLDLADIDVSDLVDNSLESSGRAVASAQEQLPAETPAVDNSFAMPIDDLRLEQPGFLVDGAGAGDTLRDQSSLSPDDTLQEQDGEDGLLVLAADESLSEDDDMSDDFFGGSLEVDDLSLDESGSLPEIELLSDDDDVPPDLPS